MLIPCLAEAMEWVGYVKTIIISLTSARLNLCVILVSRESISEVEYLATSFLSDHGTNVALETCSVLLNMLQSGGTSAVCTGTTKLVTSPIFLEYLMMIQLSQPNLQQLTVALIDALISTEDPKCLLGTSNANTGFFHLVNWKYLE